MGRWLTALMGLTLGLGLAADASAQRARIVPGQALAAEAQRVVEAVPDEGTDPPGQHYFRSNEWRQDLLVPHLEGLGGAFVGVGADQNYTMAAMAESEMLFLVDYDPMIPWIHAIYDVLIRASETPDALVARFAEENVRATTALLESGLADHPRGDRIVRHFRRKRAAWHPYLERVQGLVRGGRPFSWLSSDELYRRVRRLFEQGRVVWRNGDVTADRTMRGVADACRRLGVPVRAVYFSNAEQFFEYTDSFIENMRQLPADERAVVVRTIRHRDIEIAEDGRWHYMIHDFADFRSRLDTGVYRRSFALTADLLSAGPPFLGRAGISTMNGDTPRGMLEEFRRRRAARRR
jgi:hypothetical protein